MKVGFIGFGLIGGSIARALKHNDPCCQLYVLDYENDSFKSDCLLAMNDQILNSVLPNVSFFSDMDLILLCAPIADNIRYLKELKPWIKKDCIISDTSSVKSAIHEAVIKLSMEDVFIGGHPMAGSEKTGYENSNETLLENAYYILTPTKKTEEKKLETLKHLILAMNALPIILDYKEHDEITAAISHLPHIIAAELVNLVKDSDDDSGKMRMLAAGGFKDITRIASSSPSMWAGICNNNRKAILQMLNSYRDSLTSVAHALEQGDFKNLDALFSDAATYRSQIPNTKGLMPRMFELYLDITDEPGAIAIIATLLGSNSISIKNIGIIHNREFEQGVLRIELYEEKALKQAVKILSAHNYTIYER